MHTLLSCTHHSKLLTTHTTSLTDNTVQQVPVQALCECSLLSGVARVMDDVKHVITCERDAHFLLPMQGDRRWHAAWNGLQHTTVKADQGVVQFLQTQNHKYCIYNVHRML